MANQRSMGRIDYDLWSYDVVDTMEGPHYRVIDLAGNYHGSYHTEKAAQEAAWNNNRQVAAKQGRLYKIRGSAEIYFVLLDANVRGRPTLGTVMEGCVLMNQGGQRVWVPDEYRTKELLVVNL